ncbi:hypothetical protein [Janthinobacterium sp. HH106]|uniref:hypothetical protein n=1 Tax=Janthinobacterium sp. HH106 TaxID=1537278 RepID=UPI001586721D|nr:hypothetical protein [Janthinobacterium sp. HH106]
MAVADVFSSLIRMRHIAALDTVVISELAIMKESNRMPGGIVEEKVGKEAAEAAI